MSFALKIYGFKMKGLFVSVALKSKTYFATTTLQFIKWTFCQQPDPPFFK